MYILQLPWHVRVISVERYAIDYYKVYHKHTNTKHNEYQHHMYVCTIADKQCYSKYSKLES